MTYSEGNTGVYEVDVFDVIGGFEYDLYYTNTNLIYSSNLLDKQSGDRYNNI